jgi:hypothetical protein
MRKLLLSTAIASATLIASNAIAQTTVSGNLDISFKLLGDETGLTNDTGSYNGFGKEAQINIQNKGKLNNGMDYAAGFSLEDDGNQAGTYFNENTYINFISGNTTFHIGQDHIQNNDRTLGNLQGLIAEDLTNSHINGAAAGAAFTDIFLADVGGNPAGSYGFGIIQTVPGFGNLSALYVPNNTQATVFGGDDTGTDSAIESAYEIGFVGDLGVKGLSTHAFYAKGKKLQTAAATSVDPKGHNIGISYNMGATTVGYNFKKNTPTETVDGNGDATGSTKQNEFAVSYALTPNLTLAANYTKAEKDGVATPEDAISKSVSVGYSLGAIALTAQAAKLEAFTGVDGVDADVLYLRASTKF